MMIKRFLVYYKFQLDKGRPFATPKTPEEIERAFEEFPGELEVNLRPEGHVTVEEVNHNSDSIVIKVETPMELDDFYKILKTNLNNWHLFADRLPDND